MQNSHSDPIMPSSYILLQTYVQTHLSIKKVGGLGNQKIVVKKVGQQQKSYRYLWHQAQLELTPEFKKELGKSK
jgi:hypothetical protein